MRINGEWKLCDDGVIRPCLEAAVKLTENDSLEFSFLLDAGADRTILCAPLLQWLQPFTAAPDPELRLVGIGGTADTLTLDLPIWFERDNGELVKVRGPFNIFTDVANGDLSVLGRDVTNNFRVIYDYLDQTVMLLSPPHRYDITA